MARCLTCGRRYRGTPLPCGHEAPASESRSSSDGEEALERLDLDALRVPGYRLHEVLGTGGFGVVLAATRESDGAAAAVKIGYRTNDEARVRLELEARALQTVGPPHVPELYDTGRLDDGALYLACERLYSRSLDELLLAWQPMESERFAALADAIARAVEAVHDHGLVHRDLKPENIFVSESPAQARLIDFGIVKDLRVESPGTTVVGMALGTPEYMAPEQCQGGQAIDRRADIYALGVIMYELLTGRTPFVGSAAEVRAAHASRRPTPPSRVAQLDTRFDQLILTCLAKKPERRFADVASLRGELATAATRSNAPQATKTSARPRKGARKERQLERMGIVFFDSQSSTGDVKHTIASLGGILASVEQKRCIAVFGRASRDNPVQRALDSAHALIAQGVCERVLVDQERLRVRSRPDGTMRVFATPLARDERYPRSDDPPGVLVTSAAAEMLAQMRTVQVREGVFRELGSSLESNTDTDVTMMQIGAETPIGRDAEVEEMLHSARNAFMEREPTITTVLAESGLGKSQLCTSVIKRLQSVAPLATVIHLRSREPLGGESNRTLRELLRATLKLPSSLSAAQGRTYLRDQLGEDMGDDMWYAVASTMGWLSTDAPEVRRFSAAPMALRTAASQAAGRALRKLAAKSPVCVILDDAHVADNAALDALEYATLPEARAPIWVCVAAQPSLEAARPTWGKRAARSHTIRLQPLDDKAAAALWRQLLVPADNLSDETIARLVEKTLGNPFLMNELTRAIRRADLIRPRGRGHAHFLATDELEELTALPQVEWLAARELATLAPELVAHARLVALLGVEVSPWELEGVLGELERAGHGDRFPLDAQVGLNRLNVHGIVLMRSGGRFSFRHQLIRDHVQQSTPDALRTQIHRAAYRFYRDADNLPEHVQLPKLAAHAAASGYREEAVASYLKLAEQASYRHNYVEAELMYTRALGLLTEEEMQARMEAYNGRGLMRYRSSRFEDALDDLREARALARQRGDTYAEVSIVLDESTVLDWMQDFRTSRERIEEARALTEDRAAWSPLVEARLLLGEGRSFYRFHALDKAAEALEKAAEKAALLGDPGYETHVAALVILGANGSLQNRPEEAERALAQAIELCGERGDKSHLAAAHTNRVLLWLGLRDLDRAIEDAQRCLQLALELGQTELAWGASFNLAEVYFFAGECGRALPHLQRAIAMEPSNSKRPISRLLEARIAIFIGDIDEARRVLDEIARMQEAYRLTDDRDGLFTEVEVLQFDMAELALRRDASAREWQALLERAESVLPPLELAELFEIAGIAAWRRGDRERSQTLLEGALETCLENSLLIEERVRNDLRKLA